LFCKWRVAHPFESAFSLDDHCTSSMNTRGQLITQLTCIGSVLDFAGAPSLRSLKTFAALSASGWTLSIFSSDIHSLVPLHSAFRRAMLNQEHCEMVGATELVGDPFHSANTHSSTQAKKRLIATHAILEISPTQSKHRTSHFLIATKNRVSGIAPCATSHANHYAKIEFRP